MNDAAPFYPVPAAPEPAPPSCPALVYDGRFGELFRLCLKALLLNIVSLGFYRFWGRTRIRKYLWSRVILAGERFEYDGTGGELFTRFLLTLVILTPLFGLPAVLKITGPTWAARWATTLQFLILFGLGFLGYYTGRRYRLSRTLWRGIRGRLEGSAWSYTWRACLAWVAVALTLGFYRPWQYALLWRYEANNTCFGEQRMSYDGRGGETFGALVLSYVALVVALVAGAVLLSLIFFAVFGLTSHFDQEMPKQVIATGWPAFAGILVTALVLGAGALVVVTIYEIAWLRHSVRRTRFGAVTLATDIPWDSWFAFRFVNSLLLVLTLGLAWPFVAQRTLRFLCTRIEVLGVVALDDIVQQPGAVRPKGEGLAQLLDTGGFA